jgi:hypothetical protein
MIVKQKLPAFDSAQAGSTSSVKPDIFSRLIQNIDIEVNGTRTAGDGVNYTGVAAAVCTAIAPSLGTGLTGTLTVSKAGVPTAFTVVVGGAAWAVGDTFTVFDPSGTGLVCVVATLTGSAVATASVGGGPLFAEDCIEYVQLVVDSEIKATFKPGSLRKLNSTDNITRDLPDKSIMRIPFAHVWHVWSQWGTKDIGQLQVQVKIKDSVNIAGTFTKLTGCYRYVPVAVSQVRGDVLLQTDIPVTNVIAGWNEINDLPWQRVVALTKLLFDSAAITQVKIKVGDALVFNQTKREIAFDLQRSPQYRVPDVFDFFIAVLDDRAAIEDFVYIVGDENGVPARRNVQVEFFWDTTIAAPAPFYILAQGLERGAKQPVAVAKA